MMDRLKFFMNRLRERLWFRPLVMCVLSVGAALVASVADYGKVADFVPDISAETIKTLLMVISASMLVIATFAVGAMIASYASASSSATPRSFPLVIADDVSQNALSSFIGAFIFSIVALVAQLNDFYGQGGRFALFCLTLFVLAMVILTFVRWVDQIARLGRLGATIDKVESAAMRALRQRRCAPTLRGVALRSRPGDGEAVYAEKVGYVQRVDVPRLQKLAEEAKLRIVIDALPGTFAMPGRPLAFILPVSADNRAAMHEDIGACFQIGGDRTFDEDPRFGLVVLSEIASRALSPAVNDPGTAIDIIGTFVRLFVFWNTPTQEDERLACDYDRIEVPEISIDDMFGDSFTGIARDGAATVEVCIRLQKALQALATVGDAEMKKAAERHARLAFARAELVLKLPEDLKAVRAAGLLGA
jgi:uncharacterized membrane protein